MWQPEPEHNSDDNVHEIHEENADGDEHDTYHNETHDKVHLFGQVHYIPKEGLEGNVAEEDEYDNYHNETHDKIQVFGDEHYYPREDEEQEEHHDDIPDDGLDDDGNLVCDADHCDGCLEKEPCDVSAAARRRVLR